MGSARPPSQSGRAGKTPQAFSATRSLTGLWTGAKTGLPSFSFFAMAPMQQSAAIATTAAAMRPPTIVSDKTKLNRVNFTFAQACKTYEPGILFDWGVLLGSLAFFLFFRAGFAT